MAEMRATFENIIGSWVCKDIILEYYLFYLFSYSYDNSHILIQMCDIKYLFNFNRPKYAAVTH